MTTIETTQRSPGRIVLIVAGALLGLAALAGLAGGGALTWAHSTQRDGDGFYSTEAKTLSTPTHALVSDGLDTGTGPNWLFRNGRLGTIRVTAAATNGKPTFIGIARSSQVDSYLRGVSVDEIADIEVDPFTVSYVRRAGSASPARPAEQGFWARTATGSGKQTLDWPVQEGSWDVVVMNADGTSGVRTDVAVGAKVPVVLWLGVGLLVAGSLLVVGAAALMYTGWHRPHTVPSGVKAALAGATGVTS